MDLYASFELGGYRFSAWLPAGPQEEHRFTLLVLKEGKEVRLEYIPLNYPVTFGVDVADQRALEERTEEIIKELGIEE